MEKSPSSTRFFSKQLLLPLSIGALLIIFFVKGFTEFFVSLGVSPTTTIANLLGILFLPVVISYFIAKVLYERNGINFLASWIEGTIIICLLMAIGSAKGS